MAFDPELKTTRVHASYKRTIKTGEFQSVTIENGFDEEVTYRTQEELDARRAELRDEAMQQVVDDLKMFLEKLGATEKRVFVKDARANNAAVLGGALD
jgi:hypothetical protein